MDKKQAKEKLQALKERRGVIPDHLRESMKTTRANKKAIIQALEGSYGDPAHWLTIPEIVEKTQLPSVEVTYLMASLRKYGQAFETSEAAGEWDEHMKWSLTSEKVKL